MRTTCCLAECTPPARIRVLTGVRYCRARTMSVRSTPRGKLDNSRRPSTSAPTMPARHDLGGVVLENEHRRFARDPRHLAVDEFIGDEVADDEDAAAGEAVDEP